MSFPRYPEYKDSGIEWLGEVPAHWEVSRLKFFGELITGITPPSEDLSNYSEAGWPWVRPDDLDDQGAPVQATKFLTDQGWSYCRPVASMSALVCCIGSIGKLGFTTEVACTNQQITAVQPFYDARFLFYLVYASKPELDLRATGNVLRILNAERLGNVPAVMPPIDESAQIATFLDHETARIDALVEEQQRLIELLKEKRQAVISHAVTKGLEPDVPMKDSGVEWLGEVPAHWRLGSFRHLIKSLSNGTTANQVDQEDGSVAVSRIETISKGKVDFSKVGYVRSSEVDKRFLLRVGDILFSHINSLPMIGNAAVYEGDKPLLHGMNLLRIQPAESVESSWLMYWLKSMSVRQEVESRAKPAINQASISTGSVKSLPALIPPETEQRKIVSFLNHETARIDALLQEGESVINLLQERRTALISAAVTGKIDVRGWHPPEGSTASSEATQSEMV